MAARADARGACARPWPGRLRFRRAAGRSGQARADGGGAAADHAAGQPGAQAAHRRLRRRISRACDRKLPERRPRQAGAGVRRRQPALSGHAPRFARRQRLRSALGRHLHDPRPARSRRRHLRDRRGDGARDRPRDRPPCRAARRVRQDRRAIRPGQPEGAGPFPGAGRGGGPVAAVDRQLFTRAGVRSRSDRHQIRGASRIRSLRRGAVPDRARRMERPLLLDLAAVRRPAGHDGDASLDPRADRPGGSRSSQPRAAWGRRHRPGRLSGGDRRPVVRRRSVPGRRARDPVHPSEARVRVRGAGRLHPREPVRRADRRRRRRRGGAAARQHSDLGFRPPSPPRSPPTGSTG